MSKLLIRKRIFLSLLFITPSGFLLKLYQGPLSFWFNNYAAGSVYEIFWILVLFFFFPDKNLINKIPVLVFLITVFLEFLQLWHPKVLEIIRSNFLGSALIGNNFCFWDFPYYVIGCILGWFWIKRLNSAS